MTKKHSAKTTINKKSHVQTIEQKTVATQFFGPIPPPYLLNEYDQVIPGAAERILIMAEKNADHQREMEKTSLLESAKEVNRGQIFAIIVVISAFITSTITALNGAETTASIVGGATVCGLVAAFIMGRHNNK